MSTSTQRRITDARTLTLIIYGLQLAGILMAVTPVIGVIVNHVKRKDMIGTIYASHFDWQIRTFWWSLLWLAIGVALLPLFGVGALVMAIAGTWFLYRAVRGILGWHQQNPMPVRGQATLRTTSSRVDTDERR